MLTSGILEALNFREVNLTHLFIDLLVLFIVIMIVLNVVLKAIFRIYQSNENEFYFLQN